MIEFQEKIHSHLSTYKEALADYTELQFETQPHPQAWSLAQMYEHLLVSSHFFMRQIQKCLKKEKGQPEGSKNEAGENVYKYKSFPPIKIKPPQAYEVVMEARPKSEYLSQLTAIDEAYQNILELVLKDEGNYKVLHAALGWLNAQEWYMMQEIHLKHHFRQKKGIRRIFGQVTELF